MAIAAQAGLLTLGWDAGSFYFDALKTLLKDLGVPSESVHIWSDNQASLALIKNPILSQRSKHIDVAYHFVWERAESGEVLFEYITTEEMAADCFTKPVPAAKLEFCRRQLGMQ